MARRATRARLAGLCGFAAFTAPARLTHTIAAALPSGTLPLQGRLKEVFEEKMRNDKAPLMKDFETYAKSLPVREVGHGGGYVRLHELPFWCRREEVQAMASKLHAWPDWSPRAWVKYLEAPDHAGKTSSILPAFLESSFTHYLYIACANNGDRNFRAGRISDCAAKANEQGAAFIADSVLMLLAAGFEDGPFAVPLSDEPPCMEATARELQTLLVETLGPDAKVLFHIDEHSKMCYREAPAEGPDRSGAFRCGAFECLAHVANSVTVATDVVAVPLPPVPQFTSRDPIAGIGLDLEALMQNVPELSRIPKDLGVGQERVWATVRFRLAMRLRRLGLMWLHCRGENPEMEEFLEEYQRITRQDGAQKILDSLAAHCEVQVSSGSCRSDPNAASLLLGIGERRKEHWELGVRNLVLVDDMVSLSLEELLTIDDPSMEVYADGRDLFRALLSPSPKDYLAQTPLGVAYAWVLACEAARYGMLTFLLVDADFEFRCEKIMPGRLFPSTDECVYDVGAVKKGILYYAHEQGEGKTKHPLADLFFCTDKDELVLVNPTGANKERADKRRVKLEKWIEDEQPRLQNLTLKGIVLAPWVDEESAIGSTVCLVCGDDARRLLGGLGQLTRWLQ